MRLGLVTAIGLSNIGVNRLRALTAAPDLLVRPSVVQVELHPYNANRDLMRFCEGAKPTPIRVTAYASLGSAARPNKYQRGQAALLDDPTITRVALQHSTSAATVALAWALRRGVAIIPKSTKPERIAQNRRDALALAPQLSARQLAALDALDRGFHYLAAGWEGYAWKPGMSLEELYDDPPPSSTSWGGAHLAVLVLLMGGGLFFCSARRQRRR